MDAADSIRTTSRSSWTAAALGGLLGLAWAAALRGYMTQLVPVSQVDWFGTFIGVLLPGVVTGTLLGIAWARGRAGRYRRIGWFGLAPISFTVFPLLEPGAVQALLSQGFGGAAAGFTLIAIIGGFALSGTGPLLARLLCSILALAFLVALVLASPMIGGPGLALTEPRGAWVAALVGSLTVLLMLATSVPFRWSGAARRASSATSDSADRAEP